MRRHLLPLLFLAVLPTHACHSDAGARVRLRSEAAPVSTVLAPPKARVEPRVLEIHGDRRVDDYFWLRERESPEVLAYLRAENAFTKAMMAHTEPLQEVLFREIKGRIKQDDASVPYLLDGYWYYTRYEAGRDYPIHCRKRGSLEAEEQVLLDVNLLAQGESYCAVRGLEVSTNGNLLIYGVDNVGRRFYTLHVKDLTTGELLSDRIPDATNNVTWANDDRTFFYAKQDPQTLRWHQVWRHTIGTDARQDELVFEEQDDTFSCFVGKTKSKRFLVIQSDQTLSSEARYLDASDPLGDFEVFLPRRRDHEYQIEHHGDHFYVRTNDGARNFRLARTPVENTSMDAWQEVLPHRADVFLQDFEIFAGHLVVSERQGGLVELRFRDWKDGDWQTIAFDEPTYRVGLAENENYDTSLVRYAYSSMRTPNSIYEYDMERDDTALLKRDEVLGGFDREDYVTERLHATADDGTSVPISVVYPVGVERNGSNPLLLTGYGSYGSSSDAAFNFSRLSLLDRGFVVAIAHVRGGSELGRAWYEDGKLLKKRNTFTDFIDCAEFLVEEGFTSPERLYASGGSAGGLLIGAVANMRPELFDGLIAYVPFVDVVTTMLDDSIPLTTAEYDEWGNPNDEVYYDYMLSYSPYDQVEARDYPHLLVTTGLHDSQVQYWEPAKWVAKLRAMKTDSNRLLIKIDMESGHGGASGRDQRYKDTAFAYAFLIDLAFGNAGARP